MSDMTRQELINCIQNSSTKIDDFLNSLRLEQLASPVDSGGWAVKDHIIHLAVWEQGLIALLSGGSRHSAMGITEDIMAEGIEAINAAIFNNTSGMTVEDALKLFRDTRYQTAKILENMSDADVNLPYKHYDPRVDDERPIIHWIIINTYDHYDTHLPWIEAIIAAEATD